MMNRSRLTWAAVLIGMIAAASGAHAQAADPDARVGGALSKGMRLVYGSEGSEQPAWVVDSLDVNAAWQPGTKCSYIRFGTRDVRRHCLRNDTIFNWDETQAKLLAIRPVGTRSSMRVPGANGGYALYETTEPVQVTLSGRNFRALPTTVTTFDASGTAVRRLREQYVLALGTALGGVFEIPDPARPGQWQPQRQFSLLRID